ncbi:MAG: glutamine amidotransferase family protein [Candidatus Thioglobus sp.]|jgi:amidophosphoribosyltransferase|nr:glutamine amidotransferase family protein [Candidatus Thioglobus sp.]|tara:strand:- start:551 stop:1444 length:894 start_codon:yes stop_codon:yes gene_type:complete
MCGIVGLFIKNPALESQLGALVAPMLSEMTERGPDSAGIAVYRNPQEDGCKITVLAQQQDFDWGALEAAISNNFSLRDITVTRNHAVLSLDSEIDEVQDWMKDNWSNLSITSAGTNIEIFKGKGNPAEFIDQFDIKSMTGTHALGHTRMATESAITTEHSHPFSTGQDLCLVHNGSLSNHNRLRETLRKKGVQFKTDNDSEVAAGYLSWRLSEGDDLDQALNHAIEDLDGFYTFAIGTRDGFAVMRDPIGCKPAIMAETDDWAAMSSEYRAIATLPGAENARIWEPEPTQIYSWKRS